MKTHDYTDDQLQQAIDRACLATSARRISLADWTKDWREEKDQRLSIAKAFLAALPKPADDIASKAYQYADYILNHYSKDSHADKLVLAKNLERHGWVDSVKEQAEEKPCGLNSALDEWSADDGPPWQPHDGVLPREPTQEEKWQAEFEKCFPDFDLTKQQDGGYLHAHAATAWRAFLAAKKGGAK